MKHYSLTLLALMAAGALHAETQEVKWEELCRVASGRQIEVRTQTGETAFGFCSAVTATEITVGLPGQKYVKVARTSLAQIHVRGGNGGQLKKLRKDFRHAMGESVDMLLTPAGFFGVVAVPVVAAWGATALPFCALGDLRAKLSRRVELRPI